MATVHIALTEIKNVTKNGQLIPVAHSKPLFSETIVSSEVSQSSNNSVDNIGRDGGLDNVWVVTVIGGNVWVLFDVEPSAAINTGYLILNGQTRNFGASAGEKIAVINSEIAESGFSSGYSGGFF